MSRHSFRSFVLYFVALLFITNTRVNAFTIRKSDNVTDAPPQDLSVGESLQLEVRHGLKKPNGIDGDIFNKSSESSLVNNNNNAKGIIVVTSPFPQITTTTGLTEPYTNAVIIEKSSTNNDSEKFPTKFQIPEPFTSQSLKIANNNVSNTDENWTLARQINDMASSMTVEKMKARAGPSYNYTTDKIIPVTDDKNSLSREAVENKSVTYTTNTFLPGPQATEYSTVSINNNNDSDAILPPWKKYTVIDRKRIAVEVRTTISADIHEEIITGSSETNKNSVTFDSLTPEKRIEDLQPTMSEITTSNFAPSTPNYQEVTDTQNIEITTKLEELLTLETVFSKRAGFLNLSSKSKEVDGTTESYIFETSTGSDTLSTLETNSDERMRSTFADGPGSQRYLDDAVTEVLLQETALNYDDEITKQNREKVWYTGVTYSSATEHFNTDVTILETEQTLQNDVSNTDLTPINNTSKAKGTNMYAVNPNYKPMKKIEVQPPKTFVRDPDDNSWRNESISSLGIVFKPKNSSKPFTQVLKNKTETEWSNVLSKDSKNDVPDLRERLEKMAQRRKTKKKKADAFGNFIYSDYEESNSSEEITNNERNDLTPTSITTEEPTTFNEIALSTVPILTTQTPNTVATSESIIDSTQLEQIVTTTTTHLLDTDYTTTLTYIPLIEKSITTSTTETDSTTTISTSLTTKATTSSNKLNFTQSSIPKEIIDRPFTTDKQRKVPKIFDYYDGSDDDDTEYMELAKLELKKKITAPDRLTKVVYTTLPPLPLRFTALPPYLPDRQPTIQYFPPRNTKPVKSNRFDNDFEKRIKYNTKKTSYKNFVPITNAPVVSSPTPHYMFNSPLPNLLPTQGYHNIEQSTIKPDHTLLSAQLPRMYKSNEYTRNLYQSTPQPITSVQNNAYRVADHTKGFNRATYIVKNYKDFLEQAARDYDYERDTELVPYTVTPLRGITLSDLVAQGKDTVKTNPNFNYDYDVKFRKDVLQRFVDNFNHNEARYNDDFPVLYNNSVMHVNVGGNGEAVASSRAFLKGLYNPSDTKLGYARREPYDANCDKCTVELFPAYELHYYVPDQEEKEEAEPKPTGLPLL